MARIRKQSNKRKTNYIGEIMTQKIPPMTRKERRAKERKNKK